MRILIIGKWLSFVFVFTDIIYCLLDYYTERLISLLTIEHCFHID